MSVRCTPTASAKSIMREIDRYYALHKELAAARYPVHRTTLEQRLECSERTIKRIIENMRIHFDAPIAYDRAAHGYYYAVEAGTRFELPGLWFSANELTSLLAMAELLESTQQGILDQALGPMRQRLEAILDSQALGAGELARRTRILRAQARSPGGAFADVATAVALRRRVDLVYHGRERNTETRRMISPQRLVYYRDNWFVDAWCHHVEGLRSFSVDRIRKAQVTEQSAVAMDEAELEQQLASGYGILSGADVATAVLRFTPEAAQWVADAQWHPQQKARWLDDGRYELSLPYAAPHELLQDVLAFGADVEVVAPAELRTLMKKKLQSALSYYQ